MRLDSTDLPTLDQVRDSSTVAQVDLAPTPSVRGENRATGLRPAGEGRHAAPLPAKVAVNQVASPVGKPDHGRDRRPRDTPADRRRYSTPTSGLAELDVLHGRCPVPRASSAPALPCSATAATPGRHLQRHLTCGTRQAINGAAASPLLEGGAGRDRGTPPPAAVRTPGWVRVDTVHRATGRHQGLYHAGGMRSPSSSASAGRAIHAPAWSSNSLRAFPFTLHGFHAQRLFINRRSRRCSRGCIDAMSQHRRALVESKNGSDPQALGTATCCADAGPSPEVLSVNVHRPCFSPPAQGPVRKDRRRDIDPLRGKPMPEPAAEPEPPSQSSSGRFYEAAQALDEARRLSGPSTQRPEGLLRRYRRSATSVDEQARGARTPTKGAAERIAGADARRHPRSNTEDSARRARIGLRPRRHRLHHRKAEGDAISAPPTTIHPAVAGRFDSPSRSHASPLLPSTAPRLPHSANVHRRTFARLVSCRPGKPDPLTVRTTAAAQRTFALNQDAPSAASMTP